ncbi:DNA topoisomerase IB [Uliginosibacterium paludis]|uniref:DNA topoisomerase n=1 Tax=Uliginosibacterium paludis TaxID=1615952 RepID=A0ABV2CT42_9RHOO
MKARTPARAGRSAFRAGAAHEEEVELRHVTDELPGIRRERRGKGFSYRLPDGQLLRDREALARIRRLAIPPAYVEVWICPWPDGHLQATGRDARGRKQYRYHAQWSARRSADKFDRLLAFGEALPHIRQRVTRDLGGGPDAPLTRQRILATLVRLLDSTFMRIGNVAYARENQSYGLSTLRNEHAQIRTDEIRLRFRGKHGVRHEVSLHDRRVAAVIRRCKQLPGQALFQYEEAGTVHSIGSGDVNDYLAEAAGARFTAKDFRAWHGTVEAFRLIRSAPAGGAMRVPAVVREVARRLGNTEAVCRKAYIHPAVLALGERMADDADALEQGTAAAAMPAPDTRRLTRDEQALLAFLQATPAPA